MHILPGNFQFDGHIHWFFSQAAWADNQIARFFKVFLWAGDEQVSTSLAAKMVFFPIMAVSDSLLLADPQPDQGTATGTANQCFHFITTSLIYEFNCCLTSSITLLTSPKQHRPLGLVMSQVHFWTLTSLAISSDAVDLPVERICSLILPRVQSKQ